MYRFVGTCVNSFDKKTGECLLRQLPWFDVSSFACSWDECENEEVSMDWLNLNVSIPDGIKKLTNGHKLSYHLNENDGVFFLYDTKDDIHYFFVQ